MITNILTLKNPRGWFAAGAEVQRAITLLSDGAFKLFLYLCLNARRNSGVLEISQTDLARGLKKTTRTIRRSLEEMEAAGVLIHARFTHHPHGQGVIRIAEAFWPYQTQEEKMSPEDPGDTFVSEIRKMLQARACVQTAFSVADEILARRWLSQGVTLERIEQAILMGCTRKYVSWCDNPAQAPIASLHYFEPVLEELNDQKVAPDYWDYVRSRLQGMEALWKKAYHQKKHNIRETESVPTPITCSQQL
jgi:DNA-binding Lrp family transcriptional regulator